MRIPRVIVPGAAPGTSPELSSASFRHLVRVLRRNPGDPLVVLDGQGGVFQAAVESVDAGRETLRVRVGDPLAVSPRAGASLSVAVAIPRGDGLEVALRWGSEMGLERLIPLLTARGVVRAPRGEKAGRWNKLERWRRIAREAAEQCRRAAPLVVDPPAGFADIIGRAADFPSRWIAVPGGADLPRSGLLEDLLVPASQVLVMVGPEGGFDSGELESAAAAGFEAVGFPTHVLRTATAVAYLGVLASLGDFRAVESQKSKVTYF